MLRCCVEVLLLRACCKEQRGRDLLVRCKDQGTEGREDGCLGSLQGPRTKDEMLLLMAARWIFF